MVEFILNPDRNVEKDGITYMTQDVDWAGVECKFYDNKLIHLLFVLAVSGDELYNYNIACRYDGSGYKFRWVTREEVEKALEELGI